MMQDRMTALTDIRPRISLDDLGTPQEQMARRERILADREGFTPAAPKGRRRWAAVAGALALGIAATPGVAAAVGNGMHPQAFADAYDFWNSDGAYNVDPNGATRAATTAGPDGGAFSIITARNNKGLTCVTPLFETRASVTAKAPNDFEGGFSFCEDAPSTRPFSMIGEEKTTNAWIFYADAGEAVSGEVRMPTGEIFPVLLVRGYFFGWHPDYSGPARPTLTGFAADGSVVGRAQI